MCSGWLASLGYQYKKFEAGFRGLRLGTFSFGVSLKGRVHLRQTHAIEKGT